MRRLRVAKAPKDFITRTRGALRNITFQRLDDGVTSRLAVRASARLELSRHDLCEAGFEIFLPEAIDIHASLFEREANRTS